MYLFLMRFSETNENINIQCKIIIIIRGRLSLVSDNMGTLVENYQGVFKETLEKQYRITAKKNSTLGTNMKYKRNIRNHRCFTVEQDGKPSLFLNSCESATASVASAPISVAPASLSMPVCLVSCERRGLAVDITEFMKEHDKTLAYLSFLNDHKRKLTAEEERKVNKSIVQIGRCKRRATKV